MPAMLRFLVVFFMLTPSLTTAIEHNLKLAVKKKVNDISFLGELDYRRDHGHLFKRHYDLGVRFPIDFFGEGWSFGAHYRSIYNAIGDGDWDLEKRPYFQIQKTFLTVEGNLLPALKWAIRTRHEFRFRDKKDDSTRNRIGLKIKSDKTFYNLKPFVSNEYFYDFKKDQFTKIRFAFGMEFPETKSVKPSLQYKIDTDRRNDDWETRSSLIFKLVF